VRDALARRHGLAPVEPNGVALAATTLHRWRITDQRSVADVVRALEADAGVQVAQPNYRFVLAQQLGAGSLPADGFAVQYAPAKLHLKQAHTLTTGQPTLVAVIDTGIDRLHPEIAGAVAASFDAVGATEPPDSHGTGIAGAIVAHGRLTGIAPGARLLAIRAFTVSGSDAEATTLTIVRSIEWAVAHGARVINMSFAGPRDPEIARSIAAARRKGVVLVAAAGNDGPKAPTPYPAADPNVIAVTATDVDDRLLDVSNRGRHVALAAPGVDVLLPAPGARYQIATGTSFAAAHVSGIAALLFARDPRLSADAVRTALVANARDLGPRGRDDQFGAGLADAYKSLMSIVIESPQTVAAAR
jgi:subtilisin family serine protease